MANFFARITSAACTLVPWQDHATATKPTRLNPRGTRPLLLYRVAVGEVVSVEATVTGVGHVPLDGDLGGKLFYGEVIDAPAPALIVPVAGQTSIQRITPPFAGHYSVAMRRHAGGAVILHFEAV